MDSIHLLFFQAIQAGLRHVEVSKVIVSYDELFVGPDCISSLGCVYAYEERGNPSGDFLHHATEVRFQV